jgi:restriction endonuclease S subunit
MSMTWLSATLRDVSVGGPQYGANARAIPQTGARPRYIRITDIDGDGHLRRDGAVEAHISDGTEFLLQEGDLLVARSGNTVGKSYRHIEQNGTCIFAGYLIRFRPNPALIDSRFLFYFTRSVRYRAWVAAKKRVAGQPNINGVEYASLSLPLPAISEQRRIADLLEQADTATIKKTLANDKLSRFVPVLFHRMFGDQSRWQFKSLEEYGAHVRYGLGQPPATSANGVPLIRATNISSGRISEKDMIHVDPNDVPPSRDAFLKASDILVVRSGAYTGDVAQVTNKWAGSVAGYDLVVEPGDQLTSEFLEAYLLSTYIQKGYFHALKARAGQPHLNADQLSRTPVPFVARDRQEHFSHCIEAFRSIREENEEATTHLLHLLPVLINQALSGDLTRTWRESNAVQIARELDQQHQLLNKRKAMQPC